MTTITPKVLRTSNDQAGGSPNRVRNAPCTGPEKSIAPTNTNAST